MKKFLATALAVCMTISLAACGSSAQGNEPAAESSAAVSSEAGTEAAAETTPAAESTEVQEPAAEGAVTSIDDLPGKKIGVQLITFSSFCPSVIWCNLFINSCNTLYCPASPLSL